MGYNVDPCGHRFKICFSGGCDVYHFSGLIGRDMRVFRKTSLGNSPKDLSRGHGMAANQS
jgi:hypothetical protein